MRVCQFRHFCISFSAVFLTRHILFYTFFSKCQAFFFSFFYFFLPVQVRVNSSASSRSLFCSERILRRRFCIKVHSVQNKKNLLPFWKQVSLSVQEEGLEPSWYCYHTDLNRARLPIPPLLHFFSAAFVYISQRHVELYYKTVILSTTFFKKIFLKNSKSTCQILQAVVYYNTSVRAEQQKSSERYAEVSELADEQD